MQRTKYRFTYSKEFHTLLKDFATVHRFDPTRQVFKEAWEEWVKNNKEVVDKECKFLLSNGFNGPALDKMYKSVRYYYRKKPFMQKEPKKRKNYISVNKAILSKVDEHCSRNKNQKPEDAFQHFISSDIYKTELEAEKQRLKELNMNDKDIFRKIQKTYKNRYYNF